MDARIPPPDGRPGPYAALASTLNAAVAEIAAEEALSAASVEAFTRLERSLPGELRSEDPALAIAEAKELERELRPGSRKNHRSESGWFSPAAIAACALSLTVATVFAFRFQAIDEERRGLASELDRLHALDEGPLSGLIKNLEDLLPFNFATELEESKEWAKRARLTLAEPQAAAPSQDWYDVVAAVAAIDPVAAVLTSWSAVDAALSASARRLALADELPESVEERVELLKSRLDTETAALARGLFRLRRLAGKSTLGSSTVTTENARYYSTVAKSFIDRLGELKPGESAAAERYGSAQE